MKVEEVATKLGEVELRFEALRDNMTLFQQNINNNITWFYMVVTIIVAVLIAALYFLVKQSVSAGIEKGIEKTHKKVEELINDKKDFLHAYGTTSVSVEHGNLVEVHGFNNFNKFNFVNLTIVNRHGRVCEYHSLDIRNDGFSLKIIDFNNARDGVQLYWNLVWMNNTTYEDLLKKK